MLPLNLLDALSSQVIIGGSIMELGMIWISSIYIWYHRSVTVFYVHTYALCTTYIYILFIYIKIKNIYTSLVDSPKWFRKNLFKQKFPIYPNSPSRQRPEAIHDAKENCLVDWSCLKNPCFLFSPFYSIVVLPKPWMHKQECFFLRKLVSNLRER